MKRVNQLLTRLAAGLQFDPANDGETALLRLAVVADLDKPGRLLGNP